MDVDRLQGGKTMITEILVILAMMVLRIGVPLIIVMGLSWLAYRWLGEERKAGQRLEQVTVEEQRVRVGGPAPVAHVLYAGPHCWDIKECPQEGKEQCPAFARPELPCWLAIQMKTGHLKDECFDCQFYERPVLRA